MDMRFERGMLIVPNETLTAAFYYDPTNDELREDYEYREATSAERIYYEKTMMSGMSELTGSINDYKKSKSDVSSKAAQEMSGANHKRGKF